MGRTAFAIEAARLVGPDVKRFWVTAPRVARAWRPGQFVIVRVNAHGERIPLTVTEADPATGSISLVVQGVGKTTRLMNMLEAGDELLDVVGPLGTPAVVEPVGSVAVVAGGVGAAIAYPVACAHAEADNEVTAIVGGRTADLVLFVDALHRCCREVIVTTDDGSAGRRGLVTDALADVVLRPVPPDLVFTAGPIPMMAAVAALTEPAGIPTVASLNPLMVDGTGMCGGCRVLVDGETRFACVDGPEFDAHGVDFEVLARRNGAYRDFEQARAAELEVRA